MWKRKVFGPWKNKNKWRRKMRKIFGEKQTNIWSTQERKKAENICYAEEVENAKGGKRKKKISFFVEEKENLWRRITIDYVS